MSAGKPFCGRLPEHARELVRQQHDQQHAGDRDESQGDFAQQVRSRRVAAKVAARRESVNSSRCSVTGEPAAGYKSTRAGTPYRTSRTSMRLFVVTAAPHARRPIAPSSACTKAARARRRRGRSSTPLSEVASPGCSSAATCAARAGEVAPDRHRRRGPAERVLVVGLGKKERYGRKQYRKALAVALRAVAKTGARDAVSYLVARHDRRRTDAYYDARLAAEAVGRRAVPRARDPQHAQAAEPRAEVASASPSPSATRRPAPQRGLDHGLAIAAGTALTRDLANLPANVCTPGYLAQQARELATRLQVGARAGARRARPEAAEDGLVPVRHGGHRRAGQAHRRCATTAVARARRRSRWSARASRSTAAASRSSSRPAWTR